MVVRLLIICLALVFSVSAQQKKASSTPKQSVQKKEATQSKKTKTGNVETKSKTTSAKQSQKSVKTQKNQAQKTQAQKTQSEKNRSQKAQTQKTQSQKAQSQKTQAQKTQKQAQRQTQKQSQKQREQTQKSQSSRTVQTKNTKDKSGSTKNAVGNQTKLIVTQFSTPIYGSARTRSSVLGRFKMGEILTATEKNGDFYKVEDASGKRKGWVQSISVVDFKSDSAEKIYLDIASKNFNEKMNFAEASELLDFLSDAIKATKTQETLAEMELLRLLALRQAVSAIPYDRRNLPLYREFVKKHESFLIYDEIKGVYLVNSQAFWKTVEKYYAFPVSDRIAWEAARNPLPGECEGYLVCYLYHLRMTYAEYLRLYPNGANAREALNNLGAFLEPMVKNRESFYSPTDVTDKAEFFNLIAELRTIVSRLAFIEKDKVLKQLKQLSESL